VGAAGGLTLGLIYSQLGVTETRAMAVNLGGLLGGWTGMMVATNMFGPMLPVPVGAGYVGGLLLGELGWQLLPLTPGMLTWLAAGFLAGTAFSLPLSFSLRGLAPVAPSAGLALGAMFGAVFPGRRWPLTVAVIGGVAGGLGGLLVGSLVWMATWWSLSLPVLPVVGAVAGVALGGYGGWVVGNAWFPDPKLSVSVAPVAEGVTGVVVSGRW